jgi:DNA polymerase III psi subunit
MPTPSSAFLRQLFAGETLFRVEERALPDAPAAETPVPAPPEVPPAPEPVPAVVSPPVPAAPPAPTIASLGIEHEVLLLTNQPTAADRALLEAILKAVGLRLDDVTLLDIDRLTGADFRDLLLAQSVRYFISFGVPLNRVRLDILLPPYQVRPVEGVQFLLSEGFDVLHADKAKKRALWIALQTLFGLVG